MNHEEHKGHEGLDARIPTFVAEHDLVDAQEPLHDRQRQAGVFDAAREAEKNGILGHGLHHPMESMFEDVFEEMPWHLKEQQQLMLDEWKAAGL